MTVSVESDLPVPQHETGDAVRLAIDELSREDHAKLVLYASAFALGTGSEAEDIYHTTMVSVLDGDRLWPRGLSFMAFMKMTMRSVASNARKRANRTQLFPVGGDEAGATDHSEGPGSIGDEGCSAVENFAAAELDKRRLMDRAFDALKDDLDAQMVLLAQLEDKDAAQIKQELELNDTRYAAITKKIKRRLIANLAPKGK